MFSSFQFLHYLIQVLVRSAMNQYSYLRAVGRKVLWSSACVCLCVCVSVCLCALCLSARYLKNGFMDHHQIWWVGAGGEPVEAVQFWS